MKLAVRASPTGNGSSVQRVFLTFTASGSCFDHESVCLVQNPDGPWENALHGNGEYEVIGVPVDGHLTAVTFYCPGTEREDARQRLRRLARHAPRASTSWHPSARTGCFRPMQPLPPPLMPVPRAGRLSPDG